MSTACAAPGSAYFALEDAQGRVHGGGGIAPRGATGHFGRDRWFTVDL